MTHPLPTVSNDCLQCGACLYKHGTQKGIPQEELEMFPLLKCELCDKVSFCD